MRPGSCQLVLSGLRRPPWGGFFGPGRPLKGDSSGPGRPPKGGVCPASTCLERGPYRSWEIASEARARRRGRGKRGTDDERGGEISGQKIRTGNLVSIPLPGRSIGARSPTRRGKVRAERPSMYFILIGSSLPHLAAPRSAQQALDISQGRPPRLAPGRRVFRPEFSCPASSVFLLGPK